MTDPKSDAFEEHKRIIANLSADGLTNTVDQEYARSAKGKQGNTYRGICPVCKEGFVPGYAVRCSEPSCSGQVFHQSCFGTHTMMAHQPSSITIIMKATDIDGVWEYVDANTVPLTLPTLRELGRIPIADGITESPIEKAVMTFHGPDDDSTMQPTSETPKIIIPEDTLTASMVSTQKKLESVEKTQRSKKRATPEE